MKKLPKPKKNLKNFILGEDAKIIDKTVTKVALTITLGAFTISGVYAGGGGGVNYYTHSNHLVMEDGIVPSGQTTIHPDPNLGNDSDSDYQTVIDAGGKTLNVDVPAKTVQTIHGNHYNHTNGGGGKS